MIDNKDKLCLVLEGGGVKCAYESACLALLDYYGYKYDAVVGTSFGALTGAMYIDGGIKKLNSFYNNLKASTIFGYDILDDIVKDLYEGKNPLNEDVLSFMNTTYNGDGQKMIDDLSSKYYDFISHQVSEERLRKSKIDFGLNTIKLPLYDLKEKVTLEPITLNEIFNNLFNAHSLMNKIMDSEITVPVEVMLDEIKDGYLMKYLSATSALPPFNPVKIDGVNHYDGGLYSTMPIAMMARKGYRNFIVIRANMGEINLDGIEDKDELNIKSIIPKVKYGSSALFYPKHIKKLMEDGYNDTIEFLDKETGGKFSQKLQKKKITKEYIFDLIGDENERK